MAGVGVEWINCLVSSERKIANGGALMLHSNSIATLRGITVTGTSAHGGNTQSSAWCARPLHCLSKTVELEAADHLH